MSWNIVHLADVPAQPWRNGGGVTRELLAWPGGADWNARMSVAEVEQDGPFSRFEGVQRWFAVLAGAGVRLRIDAAPHELTRASEAFAFEGAASTDCALIAGATQDFNLMLRGKPGRMARVRGVMTRDCNAIELIAIYTHQASTRALFGSENTVLGPQTLAWRILQAGGPLRIESRDALWMEVDR